MRVARLLPGGPAARSGAVEKGDVVVEVRSYRPEAGPELVG